MDIKNQFDRASNSGFDNKFKCYRGLRFSDGETDRGIAFCTAFDIFYSSAEVFSASGMRSGNFCGSSGRAFYQDRKRLRIDSTLRRV